MDGLTLEQIGYIFGTTRERIRQVLDSVLGTAHKPMVGDSKYKRKVGKLLSPRGVGCNVYDTTKDKLDTIHNLKEYMRVVYGEETDKIKRFRDG